MKIRIQNFGPIHSFEFDLEKDFHIIYGANNIGKSYAVSLIYVLLKNLSIAFPEITSSKKVYSYDFKIRKEELKSEINNMDIGESISIKKDIEKGIVDRLNSYFIFKLQSSLRSSFLNFDEILRNRYSEGIFQIEVHLGEFYFLIGYSQKDMKLILKEVTLKSDHNIIINLIKNSHWKLDSNNSFVFLLNLQDARVDTLLSLIPLYEGILYNCKKAESEILCNFQKLYFLPASRSGLYEAMSIFSSIFAKLSQVRHLVNEKIEIPALSEPVSDYFLNLSTIKNGVSDDVYNDLAQKIEREIIGASIVFNNDNKKIEYYDEAKGLRLELAQTSSMVSEMAPIVAHLKYLIQAKASEDSDNKGASFILFIEEPEAHLHPEIQVKLMEIFAELSKHKVKVVMTTHSNYLFNKANNLILDNKLEKESVANYHMIMTEKGSIINSLTEVGREGMEDENFVPTAEKLYNERLDILEKDSENATL